MDKRNMDYFQFVAEAKKAGFLFEETDPAWSRTAVFGDVVCPLDQEKLLDLVLFAQEFGKHGWHGVFLNKQAKRSVLTSGNQEVTWYRSDHPDAERNPGEYITLREFLERDAKQRGVWEKITKL